MRFDTPALIMRFPRVGPEKWCIPTLISEPLNNEVWVALGSEGPLANEVPEWWGS